MLNKIFVNNCLGLDNFELSFESTHSVIVDERVNTIKILKNIYNGSNENEILDLNKESVIKLYFLLNKAQIDYISTYLVLDSNYLVVYKLISNDQITYFINEKAVEFNVIKRILNYLIDNRRILTNLYNDSNTILDNYIFRIDEEYAMNKYNYLKLNSLKKEYDNELDIINSNKLDESINDLINIKNEIESFELEKGEISYINKIYEKLNASNLDKSIKDKVYDAFNKALLIMKDNMPDLESLENNDKINDTVKDLEDSFYTLKERLDSFNDIKLDGNNENDQYIIERYNNIKKFQEKYGKTYKEINEYYDSIISKINYYKYSKMNLKNIEEKISLLNTQMNNINSVLLDIKKKYVLNITDYFNELCSKFDEDIKLCANLENEDINLYLSNVEQVLTLDNLKEDDNYNLITFLLNAIFLANEDKTIIVDDDFSDDFDENEMMIYIKLLNQFNNCLVLSNNDKLI